MKVEYKLLCIAKLRMIKDEASPRFPTPVPARPGYDRWVWGRLARTGALYRALLPGGDPARGLSARPAAGAGGISDRAAHRPAPRADHPRRRHRGGHSG